MVHLYEDSCVQELYKIRIERGMHHIVDLNNISRIVFSNPKILGGFVCQKYLEGTYELFYN
jgi:hypothetical protein